MDTVSYLLGKKAGGTPTVLQDKEVNITENGEQTIRADSGYDALRSVDVTTNVQPDLESKSVTISTNTTTTITPTTGKDGLSSVEVTTNVPQPTGTINIDANGTYNVANYATAEVQTPSITPDAEEKDVNFYDYDGKRVYSYTKTEFLALNEYPANPTHEGLTSQGWNWDYQDAVDYVTEYGILDVGQNYTTSDGATRITIEMSELRNDPYINFKLTGDAEIDWGDNSQVETATGSSFAQITKTHTYSPGKYTISITPLNDAQIKIEGGNLFTGENSSSYKINSIYRNYVKEINVGNNVTCGNSAFNGFNNTNFIISLPNYITSFSGNYGLNCEPKVIILPKNASSFGQYTYVNQNTYQAQAKIIFNRNYASGTFANQSFITNYTQSRAILSDKITGLYNGIGCVGVLKLIVPKTILTVSQLELYGCKVLDFSHHENIPSLGSYQPFGSDFPADCQIVVPDSLYEDWIATNNWTNYANQIISKSDFDNQ